MRTLFQNINNEKVFQKKISSIYFSSFPRFISDVCPTNNNRNCHIYNIFRNKENLIRNNSKKKRNNHQIYVHGTVVKILKFYRYP